VKIIGVVTVVVVGLVALSGIALVLRSIPDIKRYLRIRSM
jgi:hypothetical protein